MATTLRGVYMHSHYTLQTGLAYVVTTLHSMEWLCMQGHDTPRSDHVCTVTIRLGADLHEWSLHSAEWTCMHSHYAHFSGGVCTLISTE